MKKRGIDYMSIKDVENLIVWWKKQIQNEKDRIKKHVDSIYESLIEFHVPILEDAFSSENDNVADMFKDYDKDIIYINGKIFLLKHEHSKLINPKNPNEIKKMDKERYQDFKRLIFWLFRLFSDYINLVIILNLKF